MKKICLVITALLVGLTVGGCPAPQPPAPEMPTTPPPTPAAPPAAATEQPLAGKAVLMVVAPANFRDDEFSKPKEILAEAGAKITVAALRKGTVTGTGGLSLQAEITPGEVTVGDYDAVVFVGGPGMIQYLDNQSLIALAKKFHQAQKVVAAICVAPVILANAGLLEGKAATVWSDKRAALEAKGAQYTDEPVIVADQIITATGPPAAEKFGKAIVKALQ